MPFGLLEASAYSGIVFLQVKRCLPSFPTGYRWACSSFYDIPGNSLVHQVLAALTSTVAVSVTDSQARSWPAVALSLSAHGVFRCESLVLPLRLPSQWKKFEREGRAMPTSPFPCLPQDFFLEKKIGSHHFQPYNKKKAKQVENQ